MGIPPFPNRRWGARKIGRLFPEMRKCEIDVAATQDDFGRDFDVCDVRKVSKSKRDRRKKKIIDGRSSAISLRCIFTNFLSKALNTYGGNAATGRGGS